MVFYGVLRRLSPLLWRDGAGRVRGLARVQDGVPKPGARRMHFECGYGVEVGHAPCACGTALQTHGFNLEDVRASVHPGETRSHGLQGEAEDCCRSGPWRPEDRVHAEAGLLSSVQGLRVLRVFGAFWMVVRASCVV